jgi:hypothetical protein
VLKPGGVAIFTFSNRMFYEKVCVGVRLELGQCAHVLHNSTDRRPQPPHNISDTSASTCMQLCQVVPWYNSCCAVLLLFWLCRQLHLGATTRVLGGLSSSRATFSV